MICFVLSCLVAATFASHARHRYRSARPHLLGLGPSGRLGICAMPSGKRGAASNAEPAIPAKVPKVTPPPEPSPSKPEQVVLMKPRLPSRGSSSDAPAREIVRAIVPWVNQELESFMRTEGILASNKGLADLEPLHIGTKQSVGVSYKQHWVPENCKDAMQKSGLYEAGGVLFWIDPETCGSTFSVPTVEPTWGAVCDIAESSFEPVGVSDVWAFKKRILFPVSLSAKWMVKDLPKSTYPTRLVCLGGHAFIYAWYVKIFDALDARDSAAIRLLSETAMTVTLCVWNNMADTEAAMQSIKASEVIRASSKVMCDSFITFMDKIYMTQGLCPGVGCVPQSCVAPLQKSNVRYNNGLINSSMVKAMSSVGSMLTPRARQLMGFIEARFGLEVLTGSYNKVRMLANGCQKVGTEGFEWCLETMYMALKRDLLEAVDFKNETFMKGKDGCPSWISMALTQRTVVQHFVALADGVAKVDANLSNTLREKVISKVATPLLYDAAFPHKSSADAESDRDEKDVDDEAGEEQDDLVAELGRAGCCKGAILLAEAFKKTWDGTYDTAIASLANHGSPETALSDLDAETLSGGMATDLRDLMRSLHAAENVVRASGGSLPQPSLRSLVRQTSDGADPKAAEAERADVWKRAQTQRKKLVHLAVVKDALKVSSYQDIFKKRGGAVQTFVGKPGEDHRLFVASADLMNCCGAEPWKNPSMPNERILATTMDFLSGCRGVGDVTAAFDGCMRCARRDLEDKLFQKIGNYSEVFVVYKTSWNAAFKKKVLFGSDNCEVGYVSLPTNRSRLEIKDRVDQFTASGDTTSHFKTMSGVEQAQRVSLPKVCREDKEQILTSWGVTEMPGKPPRRWQETSAAGEPLFWQETKNKDFWLNFLKELNIKAVVDVSPGSGTLAVACMEHGADYFGICRDATHLGWLNNVLDRAALTYLCESGTHLYQEDLSAHIKELFGDMLKDNADDAVNDDALASDSEDET